MKKILPTSVITSLLLLFSILGNVLFSQTAGTLSFSVTTTAPSGSYGTENLLAIWIQSSTTSLPADFVKTKIKYASTGDANSHLGEWTAVSARNVTDAVSGASRSSHGTITFLWNGTNVPGTVVTDGQYYVRVEMAWDDADKTLSSYSFTKGGTLFQSNPANTANFLNVGITWTPLSTGLEDGTIESQYFNVYPNPTKGMLKIDFKSPVPDCLLQVINESGKVVLNKNISAPTTGIREVDLTSLSDGVYYFTLRFPQRTFAFSIFKVK